MSEDSNLANYNKKHLIVPDYVSGHSSREMAIYLHDS